MNKPLLSLRDLIPEMTPWFDLPRPKPSQLDVDSQLMWQMKAKKYDDLLQQAKDRNAL